MDKSDILCYALVFLWIPIVVWSFQAVARHGRKLPYTWGDYANTFALVTIKDFPTTADMKADVPGTSCCPSDSDQRRLSKLQ